MGARGRHPSHDLQLSCLITRGEERNPWRHPIDLVPPLEKVGEDLPALLQEGEGKDWDDLEAVSEAILGDDPIEIIETLRSAVQSGAKPDQLAKSLAHAAAMRIAHFGTSNEFSDWVTSLHTFTYCNALHQAVKRCPTAEVTRGIFHGAMSVYLDRFLNIPPAQLPSASTSLEGVPEGQDELQESFLALLDQRSEVDAAAKLIEQYLRQGHPINPLIDTLTQATVREDANFHTFQMLEAGVRQYFEWEGTPQAREILLAIARYLAAHSPTQRAQLQTAQIALRLHRGEALYEED
ncbi:MAG: Rieske (2Fe-2S) protein, partial [Planctomycetota bacterium]|nr:Rieske (2Fe-2S) protein [Planctomycetota bacterium]